MNTNELIDYISNSKKTTPVEVYIKGELKNISFTGVEFFGNDEFGIMLGDWNFIEDNFLKKHKTEITSYHVKNNMRNSAIPMKNLKSINSRIEPGAIIRETAEIGNNCVIMMGAVINLGAVIGDRTMIDMNTVIGGRAIIGADCHIGAGTVIAGVIEPPSAQPVKIGDGVVIGANAVVLEGVQIGNRAVIAAGSVVISDVPENVVIAGTPGKIIKTRDAKTDSKTGLVDSLRNL